jgi:hypothetical protein
VVFLPGVVVCFIQAAYGLNHTLTVSCPLLMPWERNENVAPGAQR